MRGAKHVHTLKVCAKGECDVSKCWWLALVCSAIPFWNVASTCSNIALHDISKAGIIKASKLDFRASYETDWFSILLNRLQFPTNKVLNISLSKNSSMWINMLNSMLWSQGALTHTWRACLPEVWNWAWICLATVASSLEFTDFSSWLTALSPTPLWWQKSI